jgi:hypothetical protein
LVLIFDMGANRIDSRFDSEDACGGCLAHLKLRGKKLNDKIVNVDFTSQTREVALAA